MTLLPFPPPSPPPPPSFDATDDFLLVSLAPPEMGRLSLRLERSLKPEVIDGSSNLELIWPKFVIVSFRSSSDMMKGFALNLGVFSSTYVKTILWAR